MYWVDGSYYKGDWRKGCQEGEGILYTKKDGERKGRFSNNEMVEVY